MHALRLFSLLSLAVGLLLTGRTSTAQWRLRWHEVGAFEIQNYSARDYGASPQIWDVVQDGRGVLYAATGGGVLEYDGVSWRLIAVPNGSTVRSLAVDASGRVFVGAQGDLGVIEPDEAGRPRFRSLRALLPAALQPFGEIRSTVATPEGVYFSTALGLFRWSDADGMRTWPTPGTSRRMGYAEGRLFVHERERGLLVLRGDALQPVPGGEALAGMQPAALLPLRPGRLLVLTRTDGLFEYDGAGVRPFAPEATAILREAQVMDGRVLADGLLAVSTLQRGLILLDHGGQLLRVVDRAGGLRDDAATSLLLDASGSLWVGLNNGLARLEARHPLTFFGEAQGVGGFVLDVVRHEGRLYAATNHGIHLLEAPAAPGLPPAFRPIPGTSEFCHRLLSTENGLLAGCDHDVRLVTPSGSTPVMRAESAFTLHHSARRPDRVFVGLNDGLAVLEWRAGRWADAGRVPGLRTEIRTLADGADAAVWIGTDRAGLFRAHVPDDVRAAQVERIGRWRDERVQVYALPGVLLASSRDSLFRIAEGPGGVGLEPDTVLGHALTVDRQRVFRMARGADGSLWMRAGGQNGVAHPAPGGGYTWDAAPLRDLPEVSVYAFYPEPDGVVWIGTSEGLVRYDARTLRPAAPPPTALVRSVALIGSDTLLYGGSGPPPAHLTLAPGQGALRFHYGAPGTSGTTYQVRLDGQDRDWSAWSDEPRRDYTGLREGRYAFRVRGRDAAGQIGPESAFAFSILPPWYRTGWAYAIYALLVGAAGWALMRLYNARLRARNLHLEALVKARTAQVEGQKAQLETQNAQIQTQAEQLRLLDEAKSRFFANVSHEFRTPLTLTLGPIEDLLEGQYGALPDEARGSLDLARRNAYRLLRLVNRMLDLAKLESGHLTLHARPHDLVASLRDTTAAFAPLAERRGIRLDFAPAVPRLRVAFDADRLEEIVINLLANSFKATPAGGRIGVGVAVAGRWAEIRVEDTGTGIEPESLSVIFDRFRQGRGALPGTVGTGIGLNLVQELVHLHGGEITVESEVGAGSTFTVRLPIADVNEAADARTGDSVAAAPQASEPGFMADGAPGSERSRPQAPPLPPPAEIRHPESVLDQPTVLVVDDNPDIRAYVRQHLEGVYRVEEAPDGDAGFEAARLLLPDLILSDVMMPRRDGYSLCRALKSDPDLDHVPVVLLTAKASSSSRIEGLDAEADDYLTKPFNARELLARVRNLIATRHRLREKYRSEVVVRPSGVTASSADSAFLEAIRATVEAHLSEADFSVEALAEAVSISPSQLQRRVKSLTDMTPVQLIRHMRLERAADLLAQRAGSVSEVAYAVGFNSHAYFAQSFRAHFGTTPSAYREAERSST